MDHTMQQQPFYYAGQGPFVGVAPQFYNEQPPPQHFVVPGGMMVSYPSAPTLYYTATPNQSVYGPHPTPTFYPAPSPHPMYVQQPMMTGQEYAVAPPSLPPPQVQTKHPLKASTPIPDNMHNVCMPGQAMYGHPTPVSYYQQQTHSAGEQTLTQANSGHRSSEHIPSPRELALNLSEISAVKPDDDVGTVGRKERDVQLPEIRLSHAQRRASLPHFHGSAASLDPMYKTRLCTTYLERGRCDRGDACRFAHGHAELRLNPRSGQVRPMHNPKYKTKMCKNFEPGASGICHYAERCEYIHPTDREYLVYKQKMEKMRRDLERHFRRGGSANSSYGSSSGDRSSDDQYLPRVAAARRMTLGGGYLGTNIPPLMTQSAHRLHHEQRYEPEHGQLKRAQYFGGSLAGLGPRDLMLDPARRYQGSNQRSKESKYQRRLSLHHLEEPKQWRSPDQVVEEEDN